MHTTIYSLAQINYTVNGQQAGGAGGGIVGAIFMLFVLAIAVLVIAGMWKTFAKAGWPGWMAIIPIVNLYALLKIAGRPGWWLILFFIPLVNFIMIIIVSLDVAARFGQSPLFAIGLILLAPIFYIILGFGPATYQPLTGTAAGFTPVFAGRPGA